VVWQKSNETGNAVHEPTMLLPPPSHGSKVNPCRRLSTSLNLLQLLRDCWGRLKWSCVCEVRYENGPAKVWATLCHQSLANPLLWLMKSYKGLMENIHYPGHKCSDGTSPF